MPIPLPEIERHEGWTKIGYTEQDDVKRRIQQQTQTADIKFNLEWAEKAVYEDGTGDSFQRQGLSCLFKQKDVEKLPDTEWFHIQPKKSLDEFMYFRKTAAS